MADKSITVTIVSRRVYRGGIRCWFGWHSWGRLQMIRHSSWPQERGTFARWCERCGRRNRG